MKTFNLNDVSFTDDGRIELQSEDVKALEASFTATAGAGRTRNDRCDSTNNSACDNGRCRGSHNDGCENDRCFMAQEIPQIFAW